MSRPRVSIAGLMALVLVAALGVKALLSPTPLWAGGMYTLALAGLALPILGILYRRGSRRAFWVGFAVFGWGYWILALSPWVGEAIRTKLFTTVVLYDLQSRLAPGVMIRAIDPAQVSQNLERYTVELAAAQRRVRNPTTDPRVMQIQSLLASTQASMDSIGFPLVGHSLFTLLSGLLGGMIAVRFHNTRDVTPCPGPSES